MLNSGSVFDAVESGRIMRESPKHTRDIGQGETTPRFNCDRCGKVITGAYGSMGGNIEPYVPAKCYHVGCIPTIRELLDASKPNAE